MTRRFALALRAPLALLAAATLCAARKTCPGTPTASITATFTWAVGNETSTAAYPSAAHFSSLVCGRAETPTVFVLGATATPGFKENAQTGESGPLLEELKKSTDESKEAPGSTPGTSAFTTKTLEFVLSDKSSTIGCVSMIAPSPDWVVGILDQDWCDRDTGKWKSAQGLLTPYTAGTDAGTTYTAADVEANGVIGKQTVGVIANYGHWRLDVEGADGAAEDAAEGAAVDAGGDGDDEKVDDDDDDDSGLCFPAGVTLELESGEVRAVQDVSIGDRVHVGHGRFSDVFMWTHKVADVVSAFVEIRAASGASLRLSPGHYLFVSGELVAARAVQPGDIVTLGDGRADTVTGVKRVRSSGLYNPQTVDGRIVVDGLLASTFTTAVEPALAHALLAPVRAAYALFGVTSSALEGGSPLCALPGLLV